MAANMMRVLKEDGLARKLGQAGRQRIKDHFTMERHLGTLGKVIKEAVSKKRTMQG